MTQIRIRETGQVMYEGEFRSLHPNTSFPQVLTAEILNDAGADVVLEGPQAQPTRYQTAFRDGVEQIDGQWFTKYSVADMDDEAKAAKDTEQAKSVRQQRDDKLKETDWMVIRSAETSIALAAEWATYRQALRDITAQAGFPWEITWPDAP
jgi:hypothetical protein